MTQKRWLRVSSLADWLNRHPYVLPLIILFIGGAFRFYNLNWDSDHQLHPDERWIFMVVSGANGNPALSWPHSWSQFLSTKNVTGSPLDPHFFAYGSLPFYLLALLAGAISFLAHSLPFLSQWQQVNTYGGLPLLGRALSGILDLASLVALFLIGRRVFGYWTAVLAMALGACTVLNIQLSHFYTVDTVLLPLVLLTLLAAVHIVQTQSRAAYFWGGIAFGAAMATKTTALLLVVPLGAAAVLAAWNTHPWTWSGPLRDRVVAQYAAVAGRLNDNLLWLLAAFMLSALTFVVFEPYALLDRATLVNDIAQQSSFLVTNNPPFSVPYTIQYAGSIPYLYQLKNLLFWSFGIPLGVAGFLGILIYAIRNIGIRLRADQAVLLLWVIPYFLFVGHFFAKFNRYMLPIMPVISLFGASLLISLARRSALGWRLIGRTAMVIVVGASFLYSLAYMNIYSHTNTRIAASAWIFSHIPAGTTIAEEGAWDDPLPMDVPGHLASIYKEDNLDLYDPDTTAKADHIAQVLSSSRYLIMSSARMIGSIPHLPNRYPLTIDYYHLLFGGKLHYRLIKVFQMHPQLGPITVHDYGADESFHVYDHPIVRVFERTAPVAPGQIAALLVSGASGTSTLTSGGTAKPDTRLTLTAAEWAKDQGGPTYDQMFPLGGFAMQHPIVVWLLLLELLGLLVFPFVFMLFHRLVDRGFVISKTIGLLLVGYLVWIGVRLHLALFDRGVLIGAVIVSALLGLGAGYRIRRELAQFARTRWRYALAGEVVFLLGFALFVLLRMWYPDLGHQFSPVSAANAGDGRMGEKQMELAYLNAIVRSRTFPPYDPFFAHGYINYYYYGFFLVGVICKLTQIAPATGFNLAIPMFFGLLLGGIFSVVLTLTRRITPGIIGAVFVGLLGNLNGGWQLISGLMSVATLHSSIPLVGGVVDIVSGVETVLQGNAILPAFDFWGPTRIIPPVGGPISEFPYFTYLFADLHPHLMAYPMTVAALALAVNLAMERDLRGMRLCLSLLLAGLLVGAIAITNPWDYPTYLLVIGIGALVGTRVWRQSWALQALWRPAIWIAVPAALSFILYLPFKRDYHTVFATGIGLVRDITPQLLEQNGIPPDQVHDALVTPLRIYLEHFGLFLFVLVSYLVALLLLRAGVLSWLQRQVQYLGFALYHRDQLPRLRRAQRVAARLVPHREAPVDPSLLLGFGILVLGLLAFQDMLLAFLVAVMGLAALLLLRLARRLPSSEVFVLAVLFVPLLLSLGTQVVFVKDWLAGGSSFRMNTIFKFYNQAWVLFATCAAAALYFFVKTQLAARASHARSGSTRGVLPRQVSRPLAHAAAPSVSLPQRLQESFSHGSSVTAVEPMTSVLSTGHSNVDDVGINSAAGIPAAVVEAQDTPQPLHNVSPSSSRAFGRALAFSQQHGLWTLCFAVLLVGCGIYTYAGTIARETYRTTWLNENGVPFTLDGMAFMKVAYPGDYAGISWLNAHVKGAPVIAEADDAYYNWRSRVSMFTGLPDIINGIHEGEQRYADELDPSSLCSLTLQADVCLLHTHSRSDDLKTLYNSTEPQQAWDIIHRYGVHYIYVGFSERQAYSRAGLNKFQRMVGHGLRIAYRHPGVLIYEVT